MTDIINQLDKLADLQAQVDLIRLDYEKTRQGLIPPEIRQELDDLAAEEKTVLDAAQEGIAKLEAEIKAAVEAAGASVKGAHLTAVWMKGRTSWDTRALDGYAAAHPEVLVFRKEGKPSVSIRKAG